MGGAGRPQFALGEPRPCLCHRDDTRKGPGVSGNGVQRIRFAPLIWLGLADYFFFAFRFFFAAFFFAALRAGFFAAILRTVGYFFLLFIGMERLPLEF